METPVKSGAIFRGNTCKLKKSGKGLPCASVGGNLAKTKEVIPLWGDIDKREKIAMGFVWNNFGVLKEGNEDDFYYYIYNESGGWRKISLKKYKTSIPTIKNKVALLIGKPILFRTSQNTANWLASEWFSDIDIDKKGLKNPDNIAPFSAPKSYDGDEPEPESATTLKEELKKLEKENKGLTEENKILLRQKEARQKETENIEKPQYDVFISHASEDKDFIEPLFTALKEEGLNVFYDTESIKWGDSLNSKINSGLANSNYGIIVLSSNFIKKPWPTRELDGLIQQEIAGASKMLTILHKITIDAVREFSPSLADKKALNSSLDTIPEIVTAFMKLKADDERK